MADYSKLTVVKLKEELKQRGLPQAGLKAVLIARLEESDAQLKTAAPNAVPDIPNILPHSLDGHGWSKESNVNTNGPVEPPPEVTDDAPSAPSAPSERKVEEVKIDPKTDTPQETRIEGIPSDGGDEDHAPSQPEPYPLSPTVETTVNHVSVEQVDPKGEKEDMEGIPAMVDDPTSRKTIAFEPSDIPDTHGTSPTLPAPSTEISPADALEDMEATPAMVQDLPSENTIASELPDIPNAHDVSPTRISPNAEEVLEDSRKRKRRSQSPPPSTFDSAVKKAKALDGSPVVKLPEDIEFKKPEMENKEAAVTLKSDDIKDAEVGLLVEHPLADPEVESEKEEFSVAEREAMDVDTQGPRRSASAQADARQSPTRTSPSDTRFKNLFSAPTKSVEPPTRELYPDIEDRDIAPAIHPATSALYIRNFTRPLHPTSLKEHLIALATPSDSAFAGDIITDFFLDSIKTHCLVRFSSVAEASRVRNALHDRVWPDQKTRKPLWIDFVPEDRLQKWIEVEESASKDRRQPVKRWEVAYEQGGDSIQVYLQEADRADGMGPPRVAPSNAPGPLHRLRSDPTPRCPPRPTGDVGKGFKALDDLFKFTAVKPKLYYQPVPDVIAKRRLERLAAGRGGGDGDEMRRFSFEEDALVDKGPEFGAGFRGRGRAGYAGGYGGRGREGGYRDGGYRDGSFRDGGFRDRGDMREPWRGGR